MAEHSRIPSYTQPKKNQVRELLLAGAVKALTRRRGDAAVVTLDDFDATLDYALWFLEKHKVVNGIRRETRAHARGWKDLFNSAVGSKTPSDLKVLYLCGPEPLNDLSVLLRLGILPQNVWAIESNESLYRRALNQLISQSTFIRIHHGSLDNFFEITTEVFDLIYIDACGPFPGGQTNTLRPPLLMHLHERIAPLAALVTTFSEPGEDQKHLYTKLLTYYFHARYTDTPKCFRNTKYDPAVAEHDLSHLERYIKTNLNGAYSDFITRLLIDLGRELAPNARMYDNKNLRQKYFAHKNELEDALASALQRAPERISGETSDEYWNRFASETGDANLNPGAYPLMSFLRRTKSDRELESLMGTLINHKCRSGLLIDSCISASVLAMVFEGHWKAISAEMLAALRSSWFDKKGGIFCDVPLPNLLVNTLFGVYGRPAFANPRLSARYRYKAKKTTMFSDLIILDHCRYYYDYWPTIDLVPARFESLPWQLIARCCLDRIGRHDHSSSSHPFRGSAIASLREIPCAWEYELPDRIVIK